MGLSYSSLYQSNLRTLQFSVFYNYSTTQEVPLEHSGYGFVKFSFLNVLFELDLLCSDIFSMDFCIFCSQWLTYPSVKLDLSGFTYSQRVSIWSILFLMNLDQLFQEFTVSTFLLSPWSPITYCDLRSCDRFLQLSCCRHDRAHLSWSVICDRWEFNFSHHRPIHFQFWFDQRLPRPNPSLVSLCDQSSYTRYSLHRQFLFRIGVCLYFKFFTWLWITSPLSINSQVPMQPILPYHL